MPRKKKSKFNVGDVVVYSQILSDLEDEEEENWWYNPGGIGIITSVWDDKDEDAELFRDDYEPFGYNIYWFDKGISSNFAHEIRLCNGIKNKERCSQCEVKDSCSHLQEIVLCDISEFRKRKLDIDACKARKCKHLFYCGARRLRQR
jgi:hypothetical protein